MKKMFEAYSDWKKASYQPKALKNFTGFLTLRMAEI
jgi:hypothetical protein